MAENVPDVVLKHFLPLAGCKTSKPGRFPQTCAAAQICVCVYELHDRIVREVKVSAAHTGVFRTQLLKNSYQESVETKRSLPEGDIPSLE